MTRLRTIAAPMASIGLRRNFIGWRGLMASGTLAQPDARIEPRVEQVNDEIGDDDQGGGEQDGAHHQRDIEIEDGFEREAAEAGPVEDGLGEDDAGEQTGEVEAGE